MNKNITYRSVMRKLLALTLVLILVCGMGLAAHAETVTRDLVTLDSPMNLAISVTYTDNGSGQAPELAFIAPDGQIYQKGMSEEEMTFEQAENTLYFYIPDASAGNWQIRFDDSFSGHLEVTTAPYSRDVLIEEFAVRFDLDDVFYDTAVSFAASFPVDTAFDYVLNAVTLYPDGTVMGVRELATGSARTNEPVEVYAYVSGLNSFDEYYLQLSVYVDDYGIEASDSKLSTSCSVGENHNTPGMPEEFDITLNRTTGDLKIDWNNVQNMYNAGEYILAVYSSLTPDEPVYANTFPENIKETSLLVDPSAEWINVELSYIPTDIPYVSKTRVMTIRPNDVEFEITTGENTASLQAQIGYSVPSGEIELYVFADGQTDVQPVRVTGSGSLAFTLNEHDNKIFVAYKPSEHVAILESKEIFVDRKAPILTFFEDLSSVTTAEAIFRVAGMTEAGAVVTVNGTAVQINADGSFLIELNLVPGANSFEIVSSDPAGNLSRRTVLINRSNVAAVVGSDEVQPFWKTWMPLFLAIGASLILAVLIIVLFGIKKKLTLAQILMRWSILTWIFSGIGLVVTIWLLVEKIMASNVVNTTQFFDKVQASIDEAYAALVELQLFDQRFLIALIVTIVLVVISICLTVAAVIVGKNQNKPPKQPKEPKEPKPPKQPKPKKVKPAPIVSVEPATAPAASPEPISEPAPAPVVIPEPISEPVPAPTAEPVTPRFCPNCGHSLVEGACFCDDCGHKLR